MIRQNYIPGCKNPILPQVLLKFFIHVQYVGISGSYTSHFLMIWLEFLSYLYCMSSKTAARRPEK